MQSRLVQTMFKEHVAGKRRSRLAEHMAQQLMRAQHEALKKKAVQKPSKQ